MNAEKEGAHRGLLRPNWLLVLLALADEDRHGLAIARDVLTQTDGAVRLWPATLYRTLDDMATAGLIVDLGAADHPEGESARRRYYRITSRGRTELSAAADRMVELAALARRRLRGAAT
jgi:DNA-binding PadR family transcriptional regulator